MNSMVGLLPRSVFIAAFLLSCGVSSGQVCPAPGNGLFISSNATRLGDLWTVSIRGNPGLSGALGIDDDTAISVGPAGTFCLGVGNGYTMVPFTLNAMGTATIKRQLPLSLAIDGVTRFLQAMVIDPAAPGGMWFSNSLELEFRAPRILLMDEGLNANIFFPMDAARFASINALTGAVDWSTQLVKNLRYSTFLRRAGVFLTVDANGDAEVYDADSGQLQSTFGISAAFSLQTHRAIGMARGDRATLITQSNFLPTSTSSSTIRLIDLSLGTVLNTTMLPAGELARTCTAIPRSPDILLAVQTPNEMELRRFDPLTGLSAASIPLPSALTSISAMTLQGNVIHCRGWASSTQQTVLFRYEIPSNSLTFPQGVVQFTGPPARQQLVARFTFLGAQVVTVFASPTNLMVLSDPVTHNVTTTVALSSNLPVSVSSDGGRIIAFNDQPAGTPDDYTQLEVALLQSNLVGGPGALGDVRLSAPLIPRSAKIVRAYWIDSTNQLWSHNTRSQQTSFLATPLPFTLTGGVWRLFSD